MTMEGCVPPMTFFERHPEQCPRPLLIVSTAAGSGMRSIAEALCERTATPAAAHRVIEDFLPPRAVTEDLTRYRFLCETAPAALTLVYMIPFFYWRKYARERFSSTITTPSLADCIDAIRPRTVITISHRATFWLSAFKKKSRRDFRLIGLVAEFGMTRAWRYLFWEAVDALAVPFPAAQLQWHPPRNVAIVETPLPARQAFYALKETSSARNEVLVSGGAWGLGAMTGVVRELSSHDELIVHVACGDNERLYRALIARYGATHPHVRVYACLPSLAPLMARCGSCITKPGIASILETVAAGRQLFLLLGLPQSEAHNAAYAIARYRARRFSPEAFFAWQRGETQHKE